MLPRIDHGHSEQEIYIGIHVHHVSVFVHQEHGHQNKEPVLSLPVKSTWECSHLTELKAYSKSLPNFIKFQIKHFMFCYVSVSFAPTPRMQETAHTSS